VLLGLLGDVHAEDARLARALRFFQDELVDDVLCVGDVVDGFGDDDDCVRQLRAAKVKSVRGNHERWFLEAALQRLDDPRRPRGLDWATWRWAMSLPTTRHLRTPRPAVLCHAMGEDDMSVLLPRHPRSTFEAHPEVRRLRDEGVRLVLCGHTHVRMVRDVGGLTIVNAGTLYRKDRPGVALVDLEVNEVRFYDLDPRPALASRHSLRATGAGG